ncbi:hypothetical protein LR48_Vigan501s000100 [Vigna angularis]|uniref:Uncharacterized protein n=1 Tax=Phaseolus angularis TaxID=3914 RepID=A0A0L9TD67_PHAAN|nr:hypothetical protein LR48_Vigan501s000100 [Vigna angularis]
MQESISTQKSIEASCKRMEMQIGHFIERLEDFGVETKVNPREECQAMIFGSDKILEEKKIERKEKEELSEEDKDVEKEREVVEREKRKKICVKMKKIHFMGRFQCYLFHALEKELVERAIELRGELENVASDVSNLFSKIGFKVNLVKEVKKDRDGIRKELKKCKTRSRKYRSAAVYR